MRTHDPRARRSVALNYLRTHGIVNDARQQKYYVANFLDNTITVIQTHTGNALDTPGLLRNT